MNKICEHCDARLRLQLCEGREGNFKYCFRRAGSIDGLCETITPFSTLEELYDNCQWLMDCVKMGALIKDSIQMSNLQYGYDPYMVLLWGSWIGLNRKPLLSSPIGFVTVENVYKIGEPIYMNKHWKD